ncbi:MAG: hypothetical protein PHG75_04610 [Syntrophomonas sp.]|nr:hypothetical protein [Syntrophomonas sp.]
MEQLRMMAIKRLAWFITLAFLIAWLIFAMIPLQGLTYGTGVTIFIVMAGMFAPALANLLTRLITKQGFGDMLLRPNFKGQVGTYLLVFFGPTVLLLVSAAFYFLVFPGSYDPQFTTLQ